jgi:hypothetical protein
MMCTLPARALTTCHLRRNLSMMQGTRYVGQAVELHWSFCWNDFSALVVACKGLWNVNTWLNTWSAKDESCVQECMNQGRPLLPKNFQQLLDAAESLDKINAILPQIEDLAACGFIRTAFTEITSNNCDDLQSSTEVLAIGSFLAAVSLTLAGLLFCLCGRCGSVVHLQPLTGGTLCQAHAFHETTSRD